MKPSSKRAFLLLATTAMLGLGACETVEKTANNVSDSVVTGVTDLSTKIASIKLDDLNPFSTDPALADATNAAAIMPAAGGPVNGAVDNVMNVANNGCPQVQIVNDLKQLHQFTNPDAPKANQSISSVTMDVISHSCTTDEKGMVMDMELGFNGDLGVNGRMVNSERPSFSYPYFVAVTNAQGSILAKEIFAATLSYNQSGDQVSQSETIRQVMPAGTDTGSYKVLVGFQLNPQELSYNRSLPPVVAEPVAAIETATAETAAQIAPAAGETAPATIEPPSFMSYQTSGAANDNTNPGPVTLTPADFAK